MIEKYLIEHCAPTLASMKTANLFRMPEMSETELDEYIGAYNEKFQPKGINIIVLKEGKKPLVYIYREKKLKADLEKENISLLLKENGYQSTSIKESLEHLKHRIKNSESFPHEIGLFLGYPYEDVAGFIKNQGKNSKHSGHWQVYGNENEATKLFEKYKKCKAIYQKLWGQGRSILKLTVAA